MGVGMQDHRDGRAGTGRGTEASLQTAFWTGKDDVGHGT
jgi:hypothetical protein